MLHVFFFLNSFISNVGIKLEKTPKRASVTSVIDMRPRLQPGQARPCLAFFKCHLRFSKRKTRRVVPRFQPKQSQHSPVSPAQGWKPQLNISQSVTPQAQTSEALVKRRSLMHSGAHQAIGSFRFKLQFVCEVEGRSIIYEHNIQKDAQ